MAIVITRHPSLVKYLREIGIIDNTAVIISHATPENVKDRDVIGVLPLRLIALTARFREVTMEVPQELRGKELTLNELKRCNPQLTEYRVTRV